jgi:N-ethylmaleimide reductase
MIRHERDDGPGGAQPLLRPVQLGHLRLPNRVVMAPLTRARATGTERAPTRLHAAYYGQRAGAGLIITEGAWVSERAIGFRDVPGIYSEAQADGWRRVTELVHALGGRVVVQLWHAGSALPHEMTGADIERVILDFAAAAERARRAGFDGVEIAANGTYLISRFLNGRLNRRSDAYGARRERLLLEVVAAVSASWDGRCAGVRISPYWTVADRSRIEPWSGDYPYSADAESLAAYDDLVAELGRRSVSYLHLRGRAPAAPGAVADFNEITRYRKLFGGSLIANHGFDRESGNAVVEAGVADAVSFARLFIANPDLVSRFALGHPLATSDPRRHYSGGPRGYVDYPMWPAS